MGRLSGVSPDVRIAGAGLFVTFARGTFRGSVSAEPLGIFRRTPLIVMRKTPPSVRA